LSYRTYGGGGGRRYGNMGGGGMTLSFPPFYGAVKTLVLINVVVFFVQLLADAFSKTAAACLQYLWLFPVAVTHGYIYQVVTYGFLHNGIWHIAFNMLALWMFGAQVEGGWGRRQFYEFYFFCLIGAALVTIGISYTGLMGVSPLIPTVGASGAIYGVIVAFGMLYGEQEVMLLLPPVSIKAKYMAVLLVIIELALGLGASGGARGESIAYTAHLGGALFGWIYIRFFPRQGMRLLGSERYYGIRNSYYKWKRRRAAKKFEVYMRKHDRAEYFDQYGNYKAPEDKEKGNGEGGRSGWVN